MICRKKTECFLFVSGIFFLTFGLFLLFFWDEMQEKVVARDFKLRESSKTYEAWIKSRVPIYVQYYFFNWTNPTDLKGENYKPNFQEVGPYKFWEKIEKVNVTWNENGTVSYRRRRKWYFDPNGSKGSLGDRITTINVIAIMAANMVKPMPSLGRFAMGMMIAGTQKISVTKTVSEFLFEGYEDTLLTAGRGWPSTSSKVPYDKFGWFYKRNGSSTFDGVYNVQTGENGMDYFGSVSLWNYKNETRFYGGKCGEVKGSGGEYWPWKRTKNTDVYLFSPDLCRYIRYKYTEKVRKSDVDGFKYVADPNLFDNGTFDSGNKCFCGEQCLPSGVHDISMCRFGAPVFTSYPHFYRADPVYLNAIGGLKPERSRHENFIALEPNYGIPLEISARFQINVLVKPNPYIALLDNVRQIIFPVFWLDQRVLVPADRLSAIKVLLALPSIVQVTSLIMTLLGVTFLLTLGLYKARQNYGMFDVHEYRKGRNKLKKAQYISEYNECEAVGRDVASDHSAAIKWIKSVETDF